MINETTQQASTANIVLRRQTLTNLLKEGGFLEAEQIEVVSRLQKKSHGRSISLLLIDAGVCEEAVQKAVAELSGLLFVKIDPAVVDLELVDRVGSKWCREHEIVPVCIDGKQYLAAQTPDAVFLAEEICCKHFNGVGQAIALRRDLESAIDGFDSQTRTIEPEPTVSAGVHEQTISLDVENASMKQILRQLSVS